MALRAGLVLASGTLKAAMHSRAGARPHAMQPRGPISHAFTPIRTSPQSVQPRGATAQPMQQPKAAFTHITRTYRRSHQHSHSLGLAPCRQAQAPALPCALPCFMRAAWTAPVSMAQTQLVSPSAWQHSAGHTLQPSHPSVPCAPPWQHKAGHSLLSFFPSAPQAPSRQHRAGQSLTSSCRPCVVANAVPHASDEEPARQQPDDSQSAANQQPDENQANIKDGVPGTDAAPAKDMLAKDDVKPVKTPRKKKTRPSLTGQAQDGGSPDRPRKTIKNPFRPSPAAPTRPSSEHKAAQEEPVLSPEQREAVELVREGHSVLISGKAGTGKSFLMSEIILALKDRYGGEFKNKVAVTAMTGIAGLHIQGGTLHSAFGLRPIRNEGSFKAMSWDKKNVARILEYEVLMVDEVSMWSAEFFEGLDRALRWVRQNRTEPFGGLQLILCGDFFQLPPVLEGNGEAPADRDPERTFFNWGRAYMAPAWLSADLKYALLRQSFRQRDERFVRYLDDIRTDNEGQAAFDELFRLCDRPLPIKEGFSPTQLFSRNKEVDDYNYAELANLPGEVFTLLAKDQVVPRDPDLEEDNPQKYKVVMDQLRRSTFFTTGQVAGRIDLKVGAQVMLLRNLSRTLVNGLRGKVVRGGDAPVVKFENGEKVEVDTQEFTYEVAQGTCIRHQVPLRLAWALTIHKAQGMSLDQVHVYLSDVFLPGQVYVALSRARSIEGLRIMSRPKDEKCFEVDKGVAKFYEAMEEGEVEQHLLTSQDWEDEMQRRDKEQEELRSKAEEVRKAEEEASREDTKARKQEGEEGRKEEEEEEREQLKRTRRYGGGRGGRGRR